MLKILVVEDMVDNRELFRDVLQLSDFEVLEAANGRSALEIARREHLDVILMDVTLPYMDGFGVTRQFKSEPALADIPIIFVTAHAMDRERELASTVGSAGYITKPIDIHTFGHQIIACLDQAKTAGSKKARLV